MHRRTISARDFGLTSQNTADKKLVIFDEEPMEFDRYINKVRNDFMDTLENLLRERNSLKYRLMYHGIHADVLGDDYEPVVVLRGKSFVACNLSDARLSYRDTVSKIRRMYDRIGLDVEFIEDSLLILVIYDSYDSDESTSSDSE